jgi:glycosyltransferase involved in cell wall biosynthesis
MKTPNLSIVVPVYNEDEALTELVSRCLAAAEETGWSFEILLVNDGSDDNTEAMANTLTDGRVRWIHLPANRGQFQATVHGLAQATGDWITVLDGDLQDPPETVMDLVGEAKRTPEVDAIFAVKAHRSDPIWMRSGAKLYHAAMGVLGRPLPRGAGSFCIMQKHIAQTVSQLHHAHLNLAVAVSCACQSWTTVPYRKEGREHGRSRVGPIGLGAEALGSLWYVARPHR